MLIAKVVGHVVSTQKDIGLVGTKLLVILPLEQKDCFGGVMSVAVDTVGAGAGELVLVTTGSSAARIMPNKDKSPVDMAIVGILDSMEIL